MTCWEIFTCGQVPYHGVSALAIFRNLKSGERLDKPNNAACPDEMLVTTVAATLTILLDFAIFL